MSDELTKSCVAMLKFERKVRAMIVYPFKQIFKVVDKILDFFELVISFINGCIVRSFGRLVGPFLTIISGVYMLSITPANGTIELFIEAMFVFTVLLVFTLFCWLNVPYNEYKILCGKEGK